MSEPHEPTPEYVLDDSDFALIKQVDFRLNNMMTVLLGNLELAMKPNATFWPDQKVGALRSFFFERSQAIEEHKAAFAHSQNPDVRQCAQSLEVVAPQLIAMAGALSSYLHNHDIAWLADSIQDAYNRMKTDIDAVGRNRAYGAYKSRIMKDNLEATRNCFVYEDSSSR